MLNLYLTNYKKSVGLTGYVHIMREGGKPVVVLLDVLIVVSSFLRRKKLDIGS
jgi:hypothetical protein